MSKTIRTPTIRLGWAGTHIMLGAGILLLSTGSVNAQTRATNAVRGQLSVSCRSTGGQYEGRYVYRLAGKVIQSLSNDCSPGSGTSYISIEQVFNSRASTTLLIVEGVSATSQNVRVLYIPKNGTAFFVEALGGDGYALVQKLPSRFRLTTPGGGFAISDERLSTWTCVMEIDFANGTASGELAVPFEPGLPRSVCEVTMIRVAL